MRISDWSSDVCSSDLSGKPRGRVSVSTANRAILCKTTVYSDSEPTMDTPKPPQKPTHLLDDLESIRQLLGDDNLQPPLLTDTVEHEPEHDEQIRSEEHTTELQ